MKAFDWLTIALLGLGTFMLVAGAMTRTRRQAGHGTTPNPMKGAVALVAGALLLQYFRGFDIPAQMFGSIQRTAHLL